jgi:hypothetical protein
MAGAPSREELEAAHCWDPSDVVPGRPHMTDFRRGLRLHQARWREAQGHPMGTQPIKPRPGKRSRPVGSRLPLDYALETGANFVTRGAWDAAAARSSAAGKEPHQSLDLQRLWADLLWPLPLAFNLFGDLAADLALADEAVHTWWPDAPGRVDAVRFEHSPGWLDPEYIGNLSSFSTAFTLEGGGLIAVVTAYGDIVRRAIPKPERLPRYREVADRSGLFKPGYLAAVSPTDLLVMWLQHLLLLSMLQHPRGDWDWGRLVVVHPEANTDFAHACARYRALLADDDDTFQSMTLESLLGAGALPRATAKALRARYVEKAAYGP